MIRFWAPHEDAPDHVRDVALRRDEARDLGVRRVGEEKVDALLAQPRERVQVGEAAVHRQLVHLEVAGGDDHARGGADGDGQGVGDGVVDRDELAVERAEALAVALGDLQRVRTDAVLLELRLDEREGQLGADQRDVRLLAEEERDTADVVLVAVREHDAVDVVEAVPDGREVRQDQVDSGLLLLGEEHSAVDDQQATVVLEDGHVAADLTEAAERGDPQAALRELRRGAEFRMRMTQRLSSPRAPRTSRARGAHDVRAVAVVWCGCRSCVLRCFAYSVVKSVVRAVPRPRRGRS